MGRRKVSPVLSIASIIKRWFDIATFVGASPNDILSIFVCRFLSFAVSTWHGMACHGRYARGVEKARFPSELHDAMACLDVAKCHLEAQQLLNRDAML